MCSSTNDFLQRLGLSIDSWAGWNQQVAELIGGIDSPDFFKLLDELSKSVAAVDSMVVMAFLRDNAPMFLYHDLDQSQVLTVIKKYVQGAYLLSPLFTAHEKNLSGFFQLSEIAPQGYFDSPFYCDYYKDTKLVDEAVYIVPLSKQSHIIVSLGRAAERFTEAELQALNAIEPIVSTSTYRQTCNIFETDEAKSGNHSMIHQQVLHVFNNFGKVLLTEREREIVILILRGYSMKSMAEVIGIAMGTVKVHCKNLYAKLEIKSQAELFSLFIEVMSCPESFHAADPLQAYLDSHDHNESQQGF